MSVISFCASSGGNTGRIDCDTKRDNPKVMLVGSAEFSPSEVATSAAFQTALLDRLKRAEGDSEKLYPFPLIEGVTDNTEANKEATLGNGRKIVLSEGRPGMTFDCEIGVTQEKAIRRFNKSTLPVFIFDESKNVWGRENAAGNFVGQDAQLFTKGTGFGDFNNATLAKISVNFISASDFFDDAAYVSTDFSTTDLEGLLNVVLAEISHASNVYKIKGYVKNANLGNNVNIYGSYPDALASAGLWVAKTGSTFQTTLTLTSVAKDTALEAYTVTFDSTAFTALSSGAKIKLSLAAPSVLDAADVVGIESVPLIITKP